MGLVYWVVFLSGWMVLRGAYGSTVEDRFPRPTPWGVGLWCVVAVPSLLQFAVPGLLDAGERDVAAIEAGQWWRPATSMFVQDGGWLGTAFNLVTLAVSVVLVATAFSGPLLVTLFVLGGLICNVLTVLLLAESGAGNSMATMFVVAAACVVVRWGRGIDRTVIPFVVLLATAVVLVAARDQHGIAVTTGLLTGVVAALLRRRGSA